MTTCFLEAGLHDCMMMSALSSDNPALIGHSAIVLRSTKRFMGVGGGGVGVGVGGGPSLGVCKQEIRAV